LNSSKVRPPRLAQRALTYFLRNDLAEEVMGDLEEKFYLTAEKESLKRARINYWYQVFNYLRPFAFKKTLYIPNHYDMLQNYFKIGWRNMSRQKMYSSLKVGGFALGIAACILIALFIQHELSYDQHYTNQDRIYRVVEVYNNKGDIEKGVYLPAPTAAAIKADYPEIEEVGRLNPVSLFGAGSNDIRRDDQVENIYESEFTFADPSILSILEFKFVYGDAKTALSQPNTLVLTRRKAEKFFPGENPIGKLMILRNDIANPFTVSGVIEDHPNTSHFQFDFLITLTGVDFYNGEQTNWLASNYHTYIVVRPGTDPQELAKKFHLMAMKYYLPRLIENGRSNAKEDIKNLSYKLQPIADIHLNTEEAVDGMNHGDERFTWMSGAVAIFILVIACINFINLSTAKSANRAKEVGLRKVVGSLRMNLMNLFLTASIIFSFFSFLIGCLMAWTFLPYFNILIGQDLIFPWREWWLVPALIGGSIAIGILAGFYPSFYLSAFRPIEVLKGNLARGSKSAYTRSALVVFQFTSSIILMIGTFVVYRQMQFILTTKVGFDKEHVILLQGTNLLGDKLSTFKDKLLTKSDIKSVSISDYLPIHGTKRNGNGFVLPENSDRSDNIGGQFWKVDKDYIETMGMKLIEGRNFHPEMASDSNAVIINRSMAKAFGLKDAVGRQIQNYRKWNVIGVVEDFHFETFKKTIYPLAMVIGDSPSITSVKVSGSNLGNAVQTITDVWREFAPQQPIRYTFMDDSFAKMYEDVQTMGKIFTTFSILAIIVACLGLFGLSSFMVEQRSKEISIRLILGASVNTIFRLLTQNFVRLVLIAFVLAAPVAWYIMDKWLSVFAYRTNITTDIFVIVGLTALAIALFTISYQAVRAAFINPVDKLRSE
jgi:putative ABC transport system permease protein